MEQTIDKIAWIVALSELIEGNELSDESVLELAMLAWENFPNQTFLAKQIFKKCSAASESN